MHRNHTCSGAKPASRMVTSVVSMCIAASLSTVGSVSGSMFCICTKLFCQAAHTIHICADVCKLDFFMHKCKVGRNPYFHIIQINVFTNNVRLQPSYQRSKFIQPFHGPVESRVRHASVPHKFHRFCQEQPLPICLCLPLYAFHPYVSLIKQ